MIMLAHGRQTVGHQPRVLRAAFTLIEVLVSAVILALVTAGLIYGYAQTNRLAEWSSMSLAAQSYALQGLEQVRGAKWDLSANPVWDDKRAPADGTTTNYPPQSDIMDVPVSGAPYYVTNYISMRQITLSNNTAQLREVTSKCVWTFPRTGQIFTNTVITYRAADRA
jgi:prepilin-type N-terminal cleavage/methylation domain-containing protein